MIRTPYRTSVHGFPRGLRRLSLLSAVAVAVLALGACGAPGHPPSEPVPDDPVDAGIPAVGTAGTLDLGTWNLKWFGDPERGPADEALQLANVREVLEELEVDLWSIQEVTSRRHFGDLVDGLEGYDGLLAVDPEVEDGAAYYSDFDGNELKVGLIWREELFDVLGARVILAEENHAFSGRPPVEVRLAVEGGGELVVILLHAKSGDGADDRNRRATGAEALEAYLDATWPDAEVAVLGDFNDDVDTSITLGEPSPYARFVEDPDYDFPTRALSLAGQKSMVSWPNVIDHHMVTDELLTRYVDDSAEVFRPEPWIEDYGDSTSDHYPVVTRWRFTTTGDVASESTWH